MEEILEAEDESREKKKGERWQQKRQGRRRIDGYHLLTGMDVSRHVGKRLGIIHIHPWMDRAVRWIKETQPLWIMESTRFNQHPPPPLLSAGHRLLIRSSHLLHLFPPPPTGPTRRSIHETSKLGNGIFRTLKVYIYIDYIKCRWSDFLESRVSMSLLQEFSNSNWEMGRFVWIIIRSSVEDFVG